MPPSFGSAGLAPEPTRLRQIALVVKDLEEARRLLVGVNSFSRAATFFAPISLLWFLSFLFSIV
jgi:hypothetical protein